MLRKNGKKLKVKYKLDRFVDAFLYNKRWKRYWRKRFNNLHWYYRTKPFVRIVETLFKYRFRDYNLYAIGQSHLDAAWKFTKLSTVRRVILTVQRAIKNLERYPFFKFSQTSPQYYQWIKTLKPKLFNQIKKYQKNGRFEICGGMWVEADTNLPNGESLVRQRLYGQYFYLKHFGKVSKVEFLPDTFGFSANLPQILIKSGAKYFYTSKITWNDYSEFPFSNFYWQGLDGSKIFTHCFYYYIYAVMNLSKCKDLARKPKKKDLVFDSTHKIEEILSKLSKRYTKNCSFFYGFSDGGMGPFEEEIGLIANMGRMGLLKISNIENFFKILKKECGNLIPIWKDELYLEFHRGCYTSQANIKKLNRLCEVNIRNLEILATILYLFSPEFKYPKKEIDKFWKTILFNQFHDILPGSSIQDVYYEQEQELRELLKRIQDLMNNYLKIIHHSMVGDKATDSNKKLVFNSLSWTRDGTVSEYIGGKKKEIKVKAINPFSFKYISARNLNANKKIELNKEVRYVEKKNSFILDNNTLRVVLNKNTGKIISVRLKKDSKEFIKSNKGINLKVYKNKPPKQYAAWNIDLRYTQNKIPIKLENIEVIEDSNSVQLKETLSFKNSKIMQNIILKDNSQDLIFHTNMDIHDKNLLIKINFPFDLNTNKIYGEIPYGVKERKIQPHTKFQKAKWEFPAQKWIAISDKNHGITLVNKSKYGFSANKNGLSMSLLVTTHYPIGFYFSYIKTVPNKLRRKYIDLGKHEVKYALKFHEGNWKNAHPWKFGYEFNYPLILYSNKNQSTRKRKQKSGQKLELQNPSSLLNNKNGLIEISEPNVILQTMKPPEFNMLNESNNKSLKPSRNKSIILRLYETAGMGSQCIVKFSKCLQVKDAMEMDLLELEELQKDVLIRDNSSLILHFNSFEIKTLKISFK